MSAYNRKQYLLKKKGVYKGKVTPEEESAISRIKSKWDLTDCQIKKLLQDNTLTEILEGEIDENGFTPGPRLSMKYAVAGIILIFIVLIKQLYAPPEPEIALNHNDHIIGDNALR